MGLVTKGYKRGVLKSEVKVQENADVRTRTRTAPMPARKIHPRLWDIASMTYVAFGAAARDEEVGKLAGLMGKERLILRPQQQAVVDAIVTTDAHIVVSARAGTGKTTTANEAMAWVVGYFQSMLKPVPAMEALSYHQLGLRFMYNNGIGGVGRYFDLAKSRDGGVWAMMDHLDIRAPFTADVTAKTRARKLRTNLAKLLSHCKNEAVSPDEVTVSRLCDRFGIVLEPGQRGRVSDWLYQLLELSLDYRRWGISFDDQLWYPHAAGLELRQFPGLAIVDEYQDTNGAQESMLVKLLKAGSRVMIIGDFYQSIFGFRGATTNAMGKGEEILRRYGGREVLTLPLTQTGRCPKKVVYLTQAIVPDFEALPTNQDGVLGLVEDNELVKFLKAGDVVLCRNNADLVSLAYRLVTARIPCLIKGRDFGDTLCELIDEIEESRKGVPGGEFTVALGEWVARKRKPLFAEGEYAEERLAKLQDQYDCIYNLAMASDNAATMKGTIQYVFGDGSREGKVTLSTVHKFKGLEPDGEGEGAGRIVILRPDRLGKEGRNQEESDQERNVLNVAITRAKYGLYFVPFVSRDKGRVEVPGKLVRRWREIVSGSGEVESKEDE